MGAKVRIDMAGQRYGRLVGLSFVDRMPSGHARWLFRCDCGTEIVASGGNVRAGSTTSCGCRHRELSALRLTNHGHRAARRHEPTYWAWQQMRQHARPDVCERWERFAGFLDDLGERSIGTKLTRPDPHVPFGPGNSTWIPIECRADRASRGWDKRRRTTETVQIAGTPVAPG